MEFGSNGILDYGRGESHESIVNSSLLDWCRINGCASQDQHIDPNSSPREKLVIYNTVFCAGVNNLLDQLSDHRDSKMKLIDTLNLSELKSKLESLREAGDLVALGKKEEEIAHFFQQKISDYDYESSTCHVANILDKKEMNCVGASVLGGKLLHEVGVQYLAGAIGHHLLLIVITSDGRVLWQDMQDGKERDHLENEELGAEKISGKKENGEDITPADIVAFASNPNNEGMTFFINKEYWQDSTMTVFPPEFELELETMISTGCGLVNRGKYKEAIEILQIALEKAPRNTAIHDGLAKAFKNLGRYTEAISACETALKIDPTDFYFNIMMKEIQDLAGG